MTAEGTPGLLIITIAWPVPDASLVMPIGDFTPPSLGVMRDGLWMTESVFEQ